MPPELYEKGFAIAIAIVLLYDMLKSRREMSARIVKLEDRYKNVLEDLVRDSIRTNQELTSSLTQRPCMIPHENKK